MNKKVAVLLEDINAAKRTYIPKVDSAEKSLESHFAEVERWLSGIEPEHTLSYWCGLKPEDFLPKEQFTESEMKSILSALDDMLKTWNISIDLPKNIPTAFAYKLTINTLNQKTDIVNEGMISFDFCTGYAPGCELKEYCPCLKIWNSDEDGA